jgi:drug/metabolite transporter (DMT)-like permease
MMKAKNKIMLRNLSVLILLGMLWGTGYSIARFAMTNGVSPLGYSFWQSMGPAFVMTFIALGRSDKLLPSASRARFYLISGLTGVIPNTSMYFAAPHLPAGILAMIVNTVPIFAYPMALLCNLEKFSWKRILGILFAVTGLFLVIFPKSSFPTVDITHWVLATLVTPLSFAICSIYIARYRPSDCDSLTLSAGMLTASTIILLPLVMLTHNFYELHVPLTLPDGIIILEIILSSIGYVLFFYLIKIAGPVYYSLVDTVVVLTGVTWGYLIFNEHLNKWTGLAVILIIMALLLVTSNQRKAAQLEHKHGKNT